MLVESKLVCSAVRKKSACLFSSLVLEVTMTEQFNQIFVTDIRGFTNMLASSTSDQLRNNVHKPGVGLNLFMLRCKLGEFHGISKICIEALNTGFGAQIGSTAIWSACNDLR